MAALILAATMPARGQLSPAQSEAIDRLFTTWATDSVPGCVAGVMRDGRLVYGRGFGAADLSAGTLLTPATRIGIASLSKPFTAAAVALLAGEGRIDLDADIRNYLPEMPEYVTPITVRHLVYQTSGLRDYAGLITLAGGDPELQDVSDDEVMRLVARQRGTNHRPGSAYAYSNTNYFLLGEIILRVSGQSLREFAQDRIFGPLGMNATVYVQPGEFLPGRAESYREEGGRLREVRMSGAIGGSGGIFSTVEDLARWDAHFLRPSLSADPAAFVELITEVGRLDTGESNFYGWGNQRGSYRGSETQGHGGTWGGFRVQYLRFPSERVSVSALCNQLELSPYQLVRRIADIVLDGRLAGEGDPGAGPIMMPSPSQAEPQRVDSVQAMSYVGDYRSHELDVTYQVSYSDGFLRLRDGLRTPGIVRIAHADTLIMYSRTLSIQRNRAGAPTGFVLNTGRVRGVQFERVQGPPPSLTIPRGRPVTVDGEAGAGEWTDGHEVLLRTAPGDIVRVRIKHDGEALMFGFFGLRSGVVMVPEVLIDSDHDGGATWRADDWWFHASARDCASSGRYNDYSTCAPEAAQWSASNIRGMTFPEVMELRIPMQLVGAAPGDVIGLAVNVTDTRSTWHFWPQQAQMAVPGSWSDALIER